MLIDEKFILQSRAIWGSIASILVGLGSLGVIHFTQAQADIATVVVVGLLNLITNGYAMYGRIKATKKIA